MRSIALRPLLRPLFPLLLSTLVLTACSGGGSSSNDAGEEGAGGGAGGPGSDAGGGGASPGMDAGKPSYAFVDGGLNPPQIAVTFAVPPATCPSAPACAGNEVGGWTYSAACLSDSIPSAARAKFNLDPGNGLGLGGCAMSIQNRAGTLRGAVEWDGANARFDIVASVTFELKSESAPCTNLCTSLSARIPSNYTGQCARVGADCICSLAHTVTRRTTEPYDIPSADGVLRLTQSNDQLGTCASPTSMSV